ncbi:uncharacterized protein LOC117568452 isoform X1 [Drosophila albomicans]|uniref:Uncharacterized protein LOC117568452 isoform X1 n=1 Tax=Drosophila albomicans TaxID=7291 RepID=A0A6P8YA95_DROAB|nr:uncharacterized protein LOC117568452 isoform X1 [Drosophila albomicans]
MFNSIEIPDSEDEMPEPTRLTESEKSVISGTESNDPSPKKQNELSDTSSCGKSTESLSSSEARAQIRHRARKTQHTVRNGVENEIQFETIPLDDTADGSSSPQSKVPRLEDDDIKTVVENMLDSEEMQQIIKQIAEERVRCNFLLASYHLPDMSFRLNTDLAVLKHQFRERLKKYKVENASAAGTSKAIANQSNEVKATANSSSITSQIKVGYNSN